uniref:AsIV-cont00008-ORF2 n=1 Tax=Apophua simplicipes ichnovirus TaxID=1329648 RepID=S5DYQ6_9VIRU|nr:AsIV-cont00008-ORF2 [Apophua simplicipes ichnovirus]
MEVFPVDKLFKKNAMGNNIFHEIAIQGSLMLLQTIRDNVDGQMDTYLSEINDQNESCITIVADRHRGLLAKDLIEIFVDLGADINETDNWGNTALHYSVFHRDHVLAEWLCQQPGINLNAINNDEHTPLGLAILWNIQSIKTLLESKGARFNNIEFSDSETSDDDDDDDDDGHDENDEPMRTRG